MFYLIFLIKISKEKQMNITIRKATEEDFPSILSMIKELAEFEKAPEKVTNSIEQMKVEKDLFHCFLAENDNSEIVGMALYFFAYFTWIGKSLYLDDLYVKEKYRGNKIGTALLKKIFEVAKQENCKRVRWQVLNWNHPAIEFYKKSGAIIDDEWSNCDFDKKGVAEFKI
jgi:GNAT superfamily N-acetyltransferase